MRRAGPNKFVAKIRWARSMLVGVERLVWISCGKIGVWGGKWLLCLGLGRGFDGGWEELREHECGEGADNAAVVEGIGAYGVSSTAPPYA